MCPSPDTDSILFIHAKQTGHVQLNIFRSIHDWYDYYRFQKISNLTQLDSQQLNWRNFPFFVHFLLGHPFRTKRQINNNKKKRQYGDDLFLSRFYDIVNMLVNLITSSWCHVIAQAYRMDPMNVIAVTAVLWCFWARKLWLRNIPERAERREKKVPNGTKSLIFFFTTISHTKHTILNCSMAYILLPFHIFSIQIAYFIVLNVCTLYLIVRLLYAEQHTMK